MTPVFSAKCVHDLHNLWAVPWPLGAGSPIDMNGIHLPPNYLVVLDVAGTPLNVDCVTHECFLEEVLLDCYATDLVIVSCHIQKLKRVASAFIDVVLWKLYGLEAKVLQPSDGINAIVTLVIADLDGNIEQFRHRTYMQERFQSEIQLAWMGDHIIFESLMVPEWA